MPAKVYPPGVWAAIGGTPGRNPLAKESFARRHFRVAFAGRFFYVPPDFFSNLKEEWHMNQGRLRLGIFLALLAAGVMLAGCGTSGDCSIACQKMDGCGIKYSGLNCDEGCTGADFACSECINGESKTCDALKANQCQRECFTLRIER
ncbi:MAG: hypothetical protein GMKNLPBB_01921 [Myxococcota bacterium]|nr:hypothetical protein [Myxococcota bacterium]